MPSRPSNNTQEKGKANKSAYQPEQKVQKQRPRQGDGQLSYSQQQQNQQSNYPSSSQNSYIKRQKKVLSHLDTIQRQFIQTYVRNLQTKSVKDLMTEREELLEQLYSINSHLSEMITKVYGQLGDDVNEQRNEQQPEKLNGQMKQKLDKKDEINTNSKTKSKSITNNNSSLIQHQEPEQFRSEQLSLLQQKNNKLLQTLQLQLQDYEFMLTGQYVQRLEQQLRGSISLKKQLNQQVSTLSKQLKKHTKQYDKQIISKLQKHSYDIELQLTLTSKKLDIKTQKLKVIKQQSKQKQQKVRQLQYEQLDIQKLLQMYQDQQYQSLSDSKVKKENYDKLKNKKQKLEKIINSYNNNHLKLYNRKLINFRQLENQVEELETQIEQMQYQVLLINKERKQFHEENKQAIGDKRKVGQSLMDIRKGSVSEGQSQKVRGSQLELSRNRQDLKRKSKAYHFGQNKETFNYSQEKTNFKRVNTQQVQNQKYPILNNQPMQRSSMNPHLRKRIYTQLQNSHYFSSLQRSHPKRRLATQVQPSKTQNIAEQPVRRQINSFKQPLPNTLLETLMPTNDKAQRIYQKIFNNLNVKFDKTNRININRSLKTQDNILIKDDLNSDNSSRRKGVPLQRQRQRQLQQQPKSQHSKTANQIKSTKNGKQNQSRQNQRQVKHKTQIQQMDQIQKRLVGLQKLLTKQDINLKLSRQINSYQPLTHQSNKGQNYTNYSKEVSNPKINKKSSYSVYSKGSTPSNNKQTKSDRSKHQTSTAYKELCKKLGKNKLLIQEDEDISGLIYQGLGSSQK